MWNLKKKRTKHNKTETVIAEQAGGCQRGGEKQVSEMKRCKLPDLN